MDLGGEPHVGEEVVSGYLAGASSIAQPDLLDGQLFGEGNLTFLVIEDLADPAGVISAVAPVHPLDEHMFTRDDVLEGNSAVEIDNRVEHVEVFADHCSPLSERTGDGIVPSELSINLDNSDGTPSSAYMYTIHLNKFCVKDFIIFFLLIPKYGLK